jgi:predicted nucleic acid-binding protein
VIFIDTSYFAAIAVPGDGLHEVAKKWSTALGGPFLTTEFVLVEFTNMLSTPSQRPTAHHMLRSIRSRPEIRVLPATSEWFQAGLALHERRKDQAWSLTDCISFEVMRDARIADALTHDRHFEQAGFRALLRSAPGA